MIKGNRLKDDQFEYDEDRNREEYYFHGLQSIEGVEGHAYGIMQELHDLGQLLKSIGSTVEKEENEFREIEKAEFDEEFPVLTSKLLSNWHKKMYSQFSYKALIMLIHLSFETGIVRLFDFLIKEGRI